MSEILFSSLIGQSLPDLVPEHDTPRFFSTSVPLAIAPAIVSPLAGKVILLGGRGRKAKKAHPDLLIPQTDDPASFCRVRAMRPP